MSVTVPMLDIEQGHRFNPTFWNYVRVTSVASAPAVIPAKYIVGQVFDTPHGEAMIAQVHENLSGVSRASYTLSTTAGIPLGTVYEHFLDACFRLGDPKVRSPDPSSAELKKCTCDITALWNYGCKCGGFAAEKASKQCG